MDDDSAAMDLSGAAAAAAVGEAAAAQAPVDDGAHAPPKGADAGSSSESSRDYGTDDEAARADPVGKLDPRGKLAARCVQFLDKSVLLSVTFHDPAFWRTPPPVICDGIDMSVKTRGAGFVLRRAAELHEWSLSEAGRSVSKDMSSLLKVAPKKASGTCYAAVSFSPLARSAVLSCYRTSLAPGSTFPSPLPRHPPRSPLTHNNRLPPPPPPATVALKEVMLPNAEDEKKLLAAEREAAENAGKEAEDLLDQARLA